MRIGKKIQLNLTDAELIELFGQRPMAVRQFGLRARVYRGDRLHDGCRRLQMVTIVRADDLNLIQPGARLCL